MFLPEHRRRPKGLAGRRLIDLTLGPVALSFVGAGDRESLRRITRLAGDDPSGWPARWLRERGLEGWADELDQRRKETEP
jgi:hypothetical protein